MSVMPNMNESLKQYIAGMLDELTELTLSLCVIPASSGHEHQRASFCLDWMEKRGITGGYPAKLEEINSCFL